MKYLLFRGKSYSAGTPSDKTEPLPYRAEKGPAQYTVLGQVKTTTTMTVLNSISGRPSSNTRAAWQEQDGNKYATASTRTANSQLTWTQETRGDLYD